MRRILCSLVVVLVLAAPALAETDSFARSKLNNQAKEIAALQAQVKALAVLVEQQKSKLAELQARADSNLTLIKALAKAVESTSPQAPQTGGAAGGGS